MGIKDREHAFKNAMGDELPLSLLSTAIDFIRDNMNPDEVFDADRIKKFVGDTSYPEDVFNEEDLKKWANENGYMHTDEMAN